MKFKKGDVIIRTVQGVAQFIREGGIYTCLTDERHGFIKVKRDSGGTGDYAVENFELYKPNFVKQIIDDL